MVRDYMVKHRAVHPKKVKMMFHAVPPEKYQTVPEDKAAKVRADLGLESDDKVVLVPTKVGAQRGNRYLVKTAARVLQSEPKAFFLVPYKWTHFHRQPDGRYIQVDEITDKKTAMAELQRLTSSLGIERRVLFRESWQNLDELYAMSDCVVAPFLSERFSSVNLLEAMAKGKPIIATDIGEQREFIEDGVNGYLVPPGDEEALAKKIIQILGDREELQRLSEQAEIKSKEYSLDNFVRTLQNVYVELASNGSHER